MLLQVSKRFCLLNLQAIFTSYYWIRIQRIRWFNDRMYRRYVSKAGIGIHIQWLHQIFRELWSVRSTYLKLHVLTSSGLFSFQDIEDSNIHDVPCLYCEELFATKKIRNCHIVTKTSKTTTIWSCLWWRDLFQWNRRRSIDHWLPDAVHWSEQSRKNIEFDGIRTRVSMFRSKNCSDELPRHEGYTIKNSNISSL